MEQGSKTHEKLDVARKELLDLGLRNPLLNYRTLKARGLEVEINNPVDVFNTLVTDKNRFSFLELSNTEQLLLLENEEMELKDGNTFEKEQSKLKTKLQTNYTEKQLEKRLLNTYYFARTYIEEQGVNILYLALGMLHWYESGSSQEVRKAPLILIPVQLERVSAKERFTISFTEDEIGHNISLVEKMKVEFGIDIPSLATDDEEVDISAYFSEVSKVIEGQKKWTVDIDSVVIGFFSFGKFLMYRDLDPSIWPEHSRPEEHSILNALLEDGFNESSSEVGDEDYIDQFVNLRESNHIMDADSSQILAILDANKGRNMVIQGPPGTGKSQTITNLIAEAIGHGKKVLFVSEKMAALEVVKRRLDAVGLGVACLELHSHKTNKKSLLKELASTLDLGKPKYTDRDISILEELRIRLNEYCHAVNSVVGSSGITPYEALGNLALFQIKHKELKFPKIDIENMENWTGEEYRKKESIIEELQQVIYSMGLPSKHTFWGSKKKVALPPDIDELIKISHDSLEKLIKLQDKVQQYTGELNYEQIINIPKARVFSNSLQRVIDSPNVQGFHLHSDNWYNKSNSLHELFDAVLEYSKIKERYEKTILPEAWDLELLETRQHLINYQDKWWKFLSKEYRSAKNKVQGLHINPKDKSMDMLGVVDSILKARRLKKYIEENESIAIELFNDRWISIFSNWKEIIKVGKWIIKLHEDIRNNFVSKWVLHFLDATIDKIGIQEMKTNLDGALNDTSHALDTIVQFLEFDSNIRFQSNMPLVNQEFSTLQTLLNTWKAKAKELHEMTSYNNLIEVCKEHNLIEVSNLASSWDHSAELLSDCFKWNWNQVILLRAFTERQALSNFEVSRHEHAIQKFQELDKLMIEINRYKLAEMHWKMLPQHEGGGQLGVLRREFEKKSRHLPIRQLVLRAGNAIQAIKPIFMMGPLSISTYLEPGSIDFDLVIFDEASQVKPVDAFGAIIRGKQAVVVGDSKQMPPTNFFDSITKDEEEDSEHFVSDMESILGLFAGQNAPQRMLKWHYRSRHESLITVSNYEFYEDKLITFPSPDADMQATGLKFNYATDTYYDRGRTRTNKEEAKIVAEAVIEHARNNPHLTLGVAAFSMAQMQAILNELEQLRRSNSTLEPFFSSHSHEPFFVKNLENVQGDERDVIFISIGYGKTKEGYLAMDFGALNRTGGERRLNVLITRARMRCEVFTNLRADDIDLNRSNAYGVKALKTFLKYAETGHLDVPTPTGKDFDSPFEEAVSRSLENLGYQVEPQVGSAGFFIDLAIVDPNSPGRYLLGIECDGAAYHSARSARDRDRLRQEVLEGLGWRIHRIWSTDWFRDPERELKRVVASIEQAKILAKAQTPPVKKLKIEANGFKQISRDSTAEKAPTSSVVNYKMAELSVDIENDDFNSLFPEDLVSLVTEVVNTESPVHISEVMRRVCNAFGIKRVGSRIQSKFDEVFILCTNITRKGDFLWLKDMDVPPLRTRSGAIRKVELICQEEYEQAILEVVGLSFGVQNENLPNLVYRLLGFSRVTEEMKGYLEAIVKTMIEKSVLMNKNGDLNVVSK